MGLTLSETRQAPRVLLVWRLAEWRGLCEKQRPRGSWLGHKGLNRWGLSGYGQAGRGNGWVIRG